MHRTEHPKHQTTGVTETACPVTGHGTARFFRPLEDHGTRRAEADVVVLEAQGLHCSRAPSQWSQGPVQHRLHLTRLGRRQRHEAALLRPHPLGHQHVEVRSHLQRTAEELQEAGGAALDGCDSRRAHAPSLPAEDGSHQRPLHHPQQTPGAQHHPAQRHRQRQRPLAVPHRWQPAHQVRGRLHGAPGRARRAQPAPFARKRHHLHLVPALATHLDEATPELPTLQVPLHLGRQRARHRHLT